MRESAFDKNIKNPTLKFNPRLALTSVRTTEPSLFSPSLVLDIKKSAVTEISSWQLFAGLYAIDGWGTEHFSSIFLLLPKKLARGHAHRSR